MKNKILAGAEGDYPEVRIDCPFCTDNRKRFGINLKRFIAHCFNCGERLGPYAVRKLLGFEEKKERACLEDLEKELEELSSQPRGEADFFNPSYPRVSGIYFWEYVSDPKKFSSYREVFECSIDFLASRGFKATVAEKYEFILPSKNFFKTKRLILPVFESGELVYYQARALDSTKPKYINPKNTECVGKSNCVFNLDRAAEFESIVICEGIFSAISAGENAVAVFGKELSQRQAVKIFLKGVRKATILFDPGTEKESIKAAEVLSRRLDVRIAELKGGDPNEVSQEAVSEAINTAKIYERGLYGFNDF